MTFNDNVGEKGEKMKSRWKRLLTGSLILLLSGSLSVVSRAVEPLVVDIEGITVDQKEMSIYVNHNALELASDKEVSYQVFLNDTAFTVKDKRAIEASKEKISYLVLADVSGSMSEESIEQIKSILSEMAAKIGDMDQVCLIELGDNAYVENFIQGKDKLLQKVHKIQKRQEDTNLYYGIDKALEILNTSTHCDVKKCLVVLSDGMDDQVTGITKEEVIRKIEKYNLPVYTVGMLSADPSQLRIDKAKELGSFARLTIMGEHYTINESDKKADVVADNIIKRMSGGEVLTVDVAGVTLTKDQMYLQVELKVEGEASATDGYYFASSRLSSAANDKQADGIKAEESTTEQDQSKSNDYSFPELVVMILCSLLILFIFVSYLVGIIRKRRNERKMEELYQDQEELNQSEISENKDSACNLNQSDNLTSMERDKEVSREEGKEQSSENNMDSTRVFNRSEWNKESIEKSKETEVVNKAKEKDEQVAKESEKEGEKKEAPEENLESQEASNITDSSTEEEQQKELTIMEAVQRIDNTVNEREHSSQPYTVVADEYLTIPTITLVLTKVGLVEEMVYHLTVRGEVIIGRNSARCHFSIPEDALLSSVHCLITYTGKKLLLTDLNSTNGTFVNGVPIVQPYEICQDDILLIGSNDYRINW